MSDKDAFRHARELQERMRSKNVFPEWIEAGGGEAGGGGVRGGGLIVAGQLLQDGQKFGGGGYLLLIAFAALLARLLHFVARQRGSKRRNK